MIRFRKITPAQLSAWLVDQGLPANHQKYRLRLWRQTQPLTQPLQDELVSYVEETLDDARKRIRAGFEDELLPFKAGAKDPAEGYPQLLHRTTLQGYLGEMLGVLAVEHFGALGKSDWKAPALLFRFHNQEFQHLDEIHETLAAGDPYDSDATSELRPGRTGDDALLFRISGAGVITDVLAIEAKCLATSNTKTIEKAHGKLASAGARPSGIGELIGLLSEYETPSAKAWHAALLTFYRDGYKNAGRHDGLAYAVGQPPKVPKTRLSWLPDDKPHTAYNANRILEAMEFHFASLDDLVDVLYRGKK